MACLGLQCLKMQALTCEMVSDKGSTCSRGIDVDVLDAMPFNMHMLLGMIHGNMSMLVDRTGHVCHHPMHRAAPEDDGAQILSLE